MFDLVTLIKTVGYLGILGIVFAESGLFIGFFLPGDSLVFTAGFLASQGFFNIWYLVILIFIGAVAGDNFGYGFGKKIGPMIFKKEDSLLFHKENLNRAKIFYERYGGKAVILARFIPGIRTFAPILAGVGKMNYSKFFFFNVVGGLFWGVGLSLVGYFLGNIVPNVDKYILPIVLGIIIVSVMPIIINMFKDEQIRNKILNITHNKIKYPNKLLVLNWKMNPDTLENAIDIAIKSDFRNTIIVPPFIFIEEVGKKIRRAALGAQNLFYKDIKIGSFTGEVSASELLHLGVKYVIIGHSERRGMGETDEVIAQKIKTALSNRLIPILCVGESLQDKNDQRTEIVIKNQLEKAFSLIDEELIARSNIVIAYEPVWAIGTGTPENPEQALNVIKFIKNFFKKYQISESQIKVLYGGSIDAKNISNFIDKKEIDGVLIGGASLNPQSLFNN